MSWTGLSVTLLSQHWTPLAQDRAISMILKHWTTQGHSGPRSGRFNISLSIPYTYFQTSNTDLTGRLRHQNVSRWPVTWAKPIVAEFVRYVRKLFLVKSDRRVLSNNPAPSSTALKAQVLQPLFYKLSHFLWEELTSARRTGSARKIEVLKHSL